MAMMTFTSSGPTPQKSDMDRHRRLIGRIGLYVPAILIVLVLWRDGLEIWGRLDSVSAYYYSGAVAVLTGMLVALALFLFTYDGYRNDEDHWADRLCSIVAGFAALGVALFPTSAPDGMPALPWVKPWVVKLHFGSAVVLFVMFAVFCLWLFRKTGKGQTPDRDKKISNAFYLFCGLAIVACIAWAFYNRLREESIFWPESWALIFFASSWLVKGGELSLVYGWLRSLFAKADVADDEEMSQKSRG